MTLSRRAVVAGLASLAGGALVPATALRAAAVHDVAIRNFTFEPPVLSVRHGDSIRFTNLDLAPHTATADDGSWDTGTLEKGQSATLTVSADWSLYYFCAFHPAMTARLIIA